MMMQLMWTTWFLPLLVGVIWFGGCILDFCFLRPRKGKKTSWVEILIAIFVGTFLVSAMIPSVDHFRSHRSRSDKKESTANTTSEGIHQPADGSPKPSM